MANAILEPGQHAIRSSHHYVPIIGGRLSVRVSGSGKAVVLLHKLGGSASEWDEVVADLATDRQVVVIELPGHGDSAMACNPPLVITHALLAALISQALDWLDVDQPVDFVGSSVGGTTALAFAAMFPDRTGSVISLGVSWTKGCSGEAIESIAREQIGKDYDIDGLPIERSFAELGMFGFADRAQAARMNRGRAHAGPWVAPIARSVSFDNFELILGCIRSPITFAYGSRGHYGDYALRASDIVTSGHAFEINNASAFPHEDKPEETLELIRKRINEKKTY